MRLRIAPGVSFALLALATGRVTNNAATSAELLPQLSARFLDASPGPGVVTTAGLKFNINDYASEAVWNQYVAKGDQFMCKMQANDKGAVWLMQDTRTPPSAASQYTGDLTNEMARWNWHINAHYEPDYACDFENWGLKRAVEGLGLDWRPSVDEDGDPTDGHNDCFSIQHYDINDIYRGGEIINQHYNVDGKQFTATGGYYEFAINHIDGAIIGLDLSNPRAGALEHWRRAPTDGELPALHYCADFYWQYWRNNPNVKNLRIYGAHSVVNDNTVRLVSRAFKNLGLTALKRWPGVSFEAGTDEFKALIGSPIGQTIAHMLIGHKHELGIKHITKVTVVMNEPARRSGDDMHLFYTIADVPQDEVTEPEQGQTLSVRDDHGEKRIIHVHQMRWQDAYGLLHDR